MMSAGTSALRAAPNAARGAFDVDDVNDGESKQLSLKLDPGKYVLICNLVGRYLLGMHVGFVVK
jgi:uncharacterized cupredoxin-like copper-binding protein